MNVETKNEDEVKAIIRQLQDFTRQRRLRWKDLFQEFDRHNKKRISEHAFQRALLASKYPLTNNQVLLLLDAYRASDGCHIDYKTFCDTVNEVFVQTGLERSPTRKVVRALPEAVNSHFISAKNVLSLKESQVAEQILAKVGQKCKTNGIVIKFFFKDFDKHSNGFVTKERFRRGLKMMLSEQDLGQQDVELLIKKYEDYRGDINYRRFAQDASSINRSKGGFIKAKESLGAKFDYTAATKQDIRTNDTNFKVVDILNEIRHLVKTQGIRTKNFFSDWDKMRRGKVTKSQFISAIYAAFGKMIHISPEQQEDLASKFSDGSNNVDYEKFFDFIEEDREKLRNLRLNPTQPVEVRKAGRSIPEFELDEYTDALIQRISNKVRTNRIHLKPLFEDFDRRNRGVVTSIQFSRVLTQELTSISFHGEDLNKLSRAFSSVRSADGVDYIKFIKKIEGDNKHKEDVGRAFSAPYVPERVSVLSNSAESIFGSNKAVEYDEILEKVQRMVKSARIRLHEFFKDADIHNHGLINLNQICQGLSRANVELSMDEIRTLTRPYWINNDIESSNNDRTPLVSIKWRHLARDIESVEMLADSTELENSPGLSGNSRSLSHFNNRHLQKYDFGEHDQIKLEGILKNLRSYVETNRILFAPMFQSFDKLNVGKLPKSLFRRALDSLQLKVLRDLDEEEYELICKAFLEKGSRQDVCYREFIREVDNSSTGLRGAGICPHQIADQHSANNRNSGGKLPESQNMNSSMCGNSYMIDQELLRRIQDECWSKRIRMKEFLQDFDRLRKGYVNVSKFHTAINMSGLRLTAQELDTISAKFRSASDPTKVSYMDFVHMIDGGNERLETDPTGPAVQKVSRSFDERHPSQVQEDELNAVLHPIRKKVMLRNILLMPAFERYDKLNLKAITLSQFMSVLRTNELLDLNDHEHVAQTLHKGFPASHTEKVNYRKFMEALEQRY